MKKYLILSLLMLTSAASAVRTVSIQTGNLPEGETRVGFKLLHNSDVYLIPLKPNRMVTKNLPDGFRNTIEHAIIIAPSGDTDPCIREDGRPTTPADFSGPHFMLNITYNPHHHPHQPSLHCVVTKGG